MKVMVFYSSAGEGHKKVGEAIVQEFEQSRSFEARGFDAFETALPVFRESYSIFYFLLVKYASPIWSFLYHFSDSPSAAGLLAPFRRIWNRFHSQKLRKFIREEKPDLMIATHFYAAEVIASAKRRGEFSGALITVITDAMPHSFWVNPGTDYYWVMCDENKNVLKKRGVADKQIVAGGIPIKRDFLEPVNRSFLKERYGLRDGRFTILFTSGSFGLGPTEAALNALSDFKGRIQAIVVCGRNRALEAHLKTKTWPFPVKVLGFTDVMHELMSVSDVLIAKSGGATMCESLAKSLPMIINSPIPGQETRNRNWLLANQAALDGRSVQAIKNHIRDILENPQKIEDLKTNTRKIAKPHAASELVKFASQIK